MRRAGNVSTDTAFSERHFASLATKAPVEGGVKEAEHRADVRLCARALREPKSRSVRCAASPAERDRSRSSGWQFLFAG